MKRKDDDDVGAVDNGDFVVFHILILWGKLFGGFIPKREKKNKTLKNICKIMYGPPRPVDKSGDSMMDFELSRALRLNNPRCINPGEEWTYPLVFPPDGETGQLS